jgi:chromosome segregation ATPase
VELQTQQIENQFESYKTDMDYRMKRIESVDIDVERFETDLRGAMESAEGRVMAEQVEFKATFRKITEEITDELEILEKELDALKDTAVANTTNRLSDFEKTYYADLSRRADELTDMLAQSKNDFASQLNKFGSDSEEKRRQMEADYSEELKTLIAASQNRTKEQLSHFEHEIRQKIDGITEEVGINQIQGKAAIDEMLSDFSAWKDRIIGQFDESKNLFAAQLATLDQNAAEMIDRVKEAIESDVEEYSGKAKQERSKIASEIDSLKLEAASAITDYREHSVKVLSDAQTKYDDMLSDTERRVSEQAADCEQQLRTMRFFAQETKEKHEAAQNEMVLKLQTAATGLNKTFDDLEKRLKNVIAQSESSVFEKAEERQVRLETALSVLKTDLLQTETFRPLIAELKQEYAKMQDMERDASGKLSKMSGEKKRIESLETDFNHLMAISAAIDEKKDLFTSQHDDIQNFQTKLKGFNDELNAVTSRFDRLDKKNIDLDRTIADVDRSFARLAELEKQLRECEQKTSSLPIQLAGVTQEASRVLENRDRINDAIKQLDTLEKTLGANETRMEEITRAQDVVSRAETRLQSLVQEADSLIKLFATVKTTDTKPAVPESGGLTVNKREQVIQLAHMGWKAEQIASRLKLTITEVELILQVTQ